MVVKRNCFRDYLKEKPNHLTKRCGLLIWDAESRFKLSNDKERNKKLRISRFNYLKKIGKLNGPNIGRNETKILDYIEKNIVKFPIIRQLPVCGYFVDGYYLPMNIVFEIDEKHHKYQSEKDIRRQKEIESELNCEFIRIPLYT